MTKSLEHHLKVFPGQSANIQHLKELAIKLGAFGLKLISTDIGGYLIALIKKEISTEFVNQMIKEFYDDPKYSMFVTDEIEFQIFETQPGIGTCFIEPNLWF